MRAGFAKSDITPRVGVELCGFGPYVHRYSIGVRDRLWARAMVVEQQDGIFALISCDLAGLNREIIRSIQNLLSPEGFESSNVFVCCSHTHSGPNTGRYIGWGEMDEPYIRILPRLIADAVCKAKEKIDSVTMNHAVVPCEGIGVNREYDEDAQPLERVLKPEWRPAKPELTDTECHVLTFNSENGTISGFISYFGCHPVTCCAQTRYFHGDYCGVATNLIEREEGDDVVGLFVQGALGDVNTCVVHKPEIDSLLALDVIAGRYARSIREGIRTAKQVSNETVVSTTREMNFTRKPWDLEKLKALKAQADAVIDTPDARDDSRTKEINIPMETVYSTALRELIRRLERGQPLCDPTVVSGMRIGPVSFLGSGFETFQAIKNQVVEKAQSEITLVVSVANDTTGYAPDHTCAERGGYAADMVPLICGEIPYVGIHDELVKALLDVDDALTRKG